MRLDPTDWEKGINQAYLQELCAYWKNRFDWTQQEAYINRFHHYISEVDGWLLCPTCHQPVLCIARMLYVWCQINILP